MTYTNKLQALIASAVLCLSSAAQAGTYQATDIAANMRDMSGGADLIVGRDDWTMPTDLPFNFTFNDLIYNKVIVSTNGFVSFTSNEHGCCGNNQLGVSGSSRIGVALAPLWTDWISSVQTKTVGEVGSRELIFNWGGWEYGTSPTNTHADFQLIMHEGSNRIEFQYGQTVLANHHGVAGIQSLDQGLAVLSHNNNTPALEVSNRGFMFQDMNPSNNPVPGTGPSPSTPTPVPEAETWAMMGAGLGALALMARRRRKA